MVFTVLTLSQMCHVLAIRTEKKSLFGAGMFANPLLIFAVLLTFALQMATIYLPVLAALPLQYGVVGGEVIRDTTYMVVLVSISLTALLVIAYPLPAMQRFYGRALGKQPGDTHKVPAYPHPQE